MKIYLHELSDQETQLSFDESTPWVTEAVLRADEARSEDEPAKPANSSADTRAAKVEMTLRKVDEVVVVDGQIDTEVQLLCSRCAVRFSMKAHPHFSSLFCKDPSMAGVAHLGKAREQGTEILKPMGQNKGHARHAHDDSLDDAYGNGGGGDLDITYIAEDHINLSDVISEQLQLLIPFQPLCKEDCKGMCSHCGADQNVGRCACAKLFKETPFSALKDLKL